MPIVLLGTVLTMAYFVSHAVFGTHGLLVKDRLVERSISIERDIAVLEAVRSRLRQDIAALSQEPPAPDITEETARAVLGVIRPGDKVVVRQAGPGGRQ